MPALLEPLARNATIIADEPDAVRQWARLKQRYRELRGHDDRGVPLTTNADVMKLSTAWSELVARGDGELRNPSERRRWRRCLSDVARHAKPGPASAPYAKNAELWDVCLRRLAIDLESSKIVPGRFELLAEAVAETVAELPRKAETFSQWVKWLAIGTAVTAGATIAIGVLRRD